MRRPSSVFLAAILVSVLVGCDAFTGPDSPEVLRSELVEGGPLARVLEVELAEPAPLVVQHGSNDGTRLENTSPSARLHRVPLVRLRAERSYTYRVPGTAIEGSFEAGALPGDLAGLSYRTTGTCGLPLALLHLFTPDGFRGYAVEDGAGEVVWYWRTEGFPYGATRRDHGDFVLMDGERGLLQLTPGLEVVHELPQDTVARELHHDVVRSRDGTVLFLAFDAREYEGRRLKGEGRVLLFDNRAEQGGGSRAVEFEVEGDEARRVWGWSPPRRNFAAAVSSVRRSSGGRSLVAFDMSAGLVGSTGPVETYPIGPEGDIRWHLEVDGVLVMFRAEPVASVAGEG